MVLTVKGRSSWKSNCHVDPPLSGRIRVHPKILCPRLREIDFIRWIGESVPAGVLWRAFNPTPETVKNSQERAGAPARSAPVTHRGFQGQLATGVRVVGFRLTYGKSTTSQFVICCTCQFLKKKLPEGLRGIHHGLAHQE